MIEFEERLTHEYSKLAEQYAQEQKERSAQVESLGKQVRQWAEQYAREQTRLGDQVASLGAHVRRLADQSAQERKAHTEWASYARGATTTNGRTCHDLDHRIRRAVAERQQNDRRLQQCYERVGNTYSMIHPEAEQKRKDGDRPDRVEGLIESHIQNRMRSRDIEL